MMQFVNNIWNALSSENEELLNLLMIPGGIIESYLFMNLFLNLFNVKSSKKEKIQYVLLLFIISTFTLNIIPSPYNVLINYIVSICLIYFIFKLGFLKSFISSIIPSFILGILNTLLQNHYLTLFNIDPTKFISTPICRIPYLVILYSCMCLINVLVKRFRQINLDLIDSLDTRTLIILIINLCIGFLTLCIQLIVTTFYIDIVPIIITVLNFILLASFLLLSIYSFSRMIKLSNTKRDLQIAEEYNKSLEILYDKVKGFKHDFNNIVSTLDGYIENNDMNGLKEYFEDVKKDCKITNNLSLINPRIINDPGIYSLLNNKYFKATSLGISFDIEFFLNLSNLKINKYHFSRILGILIDNAIEEAEKCTQKVVRISFINEERNNRAVICVKNTYLNKDVDLEKIFEKGLSSKENHSGIGLWEVRKYVKKGKNLDLYTSKDNKYFKQELFIYNL